MLYPFPDKDVSQYLKRFKKVKDVVWCQEEPRNMGSWQYIAPRIQELRQRGQKLSYVGRQASASPAAGQEKIHDAEQEKLVRTALNITEETEHRAWRFVEELV